MTKHIHCAFVKHENSEKTYLFCVGREEKIRGGTKVVCDTRIGREGGVVFGDSFMVSEDALKSLCPAVGASLPLRDIVGIVKKVKAEKTTYFDGYFPSMAEMPF